MMARPASFTAAARRAILWVLCASAASWALPARPAVQLPPGVEVLVAADPPKATVGDPIRIDIRLKLPPGYLAELADPGRQVGDFTVLDFHPGPDALPSAETPVHRAWIVVALYRTGAFEFPPLSISLRDAAGNTFTVSSEPVKIQIESVLAAEDQELRNLKRQADIAEPARWRLWLGLAAALLALAALAWWLLRRRKRPAAPSLPIAPQRYPLESAEAELRELIARRLLKRGMVKQFYILLSDIMRKIIEAGYAVQTLEKTTSEIMEGLRRRVSGDGSAAGLPRIEAFLTGCDLVKFAKYIPSAPENAAAVDSAFQILAECKSKLDKPHDRSNDRDDPVILSEKK